MTLTIPDRDELLSETLAWLLGERPELDVSVDSPDGARVKAFAELLFGLYKQIEAIQKDIWPAPGIPTASLEKHAEMRLGKDPRKKAVGSTGTSALRVTGTATGAAVKAGDTLSHNDGTRYQLTTGGTVGIGTLDCSVEAIDTGESTNKLIGDKLKFESPGANIQTDATLVGNLTGGEEEETDEELLVRVLQAIVNPPSGGRFADYWRWVMEVDGVHLAFCYGPTATSLTGRRGYGIVEVAVLVDGAGVSRLPSGALVQLVNDALESERPVTTKDTRALSPAADFQRCEILVVPDVGYEWDWTGAGEVSSWDSGTKRLTFAAALPPSLIAAVDGGKTPRLFLNGEVCSVSSYDAPGHYVVLSSAPTVTPASPDPIWPAGPLSQDALDAIKDCYDALGPARGSAYDPGQEGWDDTLRPSQICASVVSKTLSDGTTTGITGCKDCIVLAPSSSYTPTDHAPTGVPDLVVYPTFRFPDCITVRPA